MKHYDYIFCGAGLAALLTVWRMSQSRTFEGRSILLIDQDAKQSNDRTWCFWEKGAGIFDDIVSKTWDSIVFSDGQARKMAILPYRYKMIRGDDFYRFIFDALKAHDNIVFCQDAVTGIREAGGHAVVQTAGGAIFCGKVFSSLYDPKIPLNGPFPVLQQHFTGWQIKTSEPVFNPEAATFMDFSVPQHGLTRFMYVLPTSDTEALVEYTLFSKDLLPAGQYEQAITEYLVRLGVTQFEITERERGSIPMTVFPFWKRNSENIMHIGSAGGWTKASTGFTFASAMRKSQALVAFLSRHTDLRQFFRPNRFRFYDKLLLDILDKQNARGHEIFGAMFASGDPRLILKFLDEETTFAEDLRVILKCPKRLFLKALVGRL